MLDASDLFLVEIPEGSIFSLSLLALLWKSNFVIDLPVKLFLCLQHGNICEPQSALVVQKVAQSDSSELIKVVIAQEHVATGQSSIPTSSSNFLDIVLNTSRQIVMDDRLNVTFVNAHTESDSAAQDPSSVLNKVFLSLCSLFVGLTGMIRRCYEAILIQKLCNLISSASLSSEEED